jgi:hypothetical protein
LNVPIEIRSNSVLSQASCTRDVSKLEQEMSKFINGDAIIILTILVLVYLQNNPQSVHNPLPAIS